MGPFARYWKEERRGQVRITLDVQVLHIRHFLLGHTAAHMACDQNLRQGFVHTTTLSTQYCQLLFSFQRQRLRPTSSDLDTLFSSPVR